MHLWSGGGGSACTLLGSGDPAPEAEPPALVAWRVLLPTVRHRHAARPVWVDWFPQIGKRVPGDFIVPADSEMAKVYEM